MLQIFQDAAYMPHGYCLFWDPWLVALHAGPDLLIFLSYSVIPLALFRLLRLRPDLREYRTLIGLFGAFILLCGLTHLIGMLTLWYAIYPLHGFVKLLTALVSVTTAAVLFPLVPRLARLPSPSQLEQVNLGLRDEVLSHQHTAALLEDAKLDLERRIRERTAQLAAANERQTLLTREAVHRSKNLLMVVQSLARQTARNAEDIDGFLTRFDGRMSALADATGMVMQGNNTGSTSLRALLAQQLEPHISSYGDRLIVSGPEVRLGASGAQQFGLLAHELATNAVKHGALSGDRGQVRVTWDFEGQDLRFHWIESGGDPRPVPSPPPEGSAARRKAGFGSFLIDQAVPMQLNGTGTREVMETGMEYVLTVPVASLMPDDESADPIGDTNGEAEDPAPRAT